MKNLILYGIAFCFVQPALAQLDSDSVINKVERNNLAIQSNKKFWDAKSNEFKTGLTPYDPFVEYDFMYGSPAGAGNQRDFAVTQRFDFPTVYNRKKELSGRQVEQTNLQQQVFRQNILLEAKLLTLQAIYLNKKAAELNRRQTNIEKLVQDYQQKMEKGDVIILDLNKAKLQLLSIKSEVALNDNEKTILLTKITALNGGLPLSINDTLYPPVSSVPSFDILDSTIEANDPIIKVYEQEKQIMEWQVSLQKAMNLPKVEAGYHSQGILGQRYTGFHVGMSVPLWENKNKLNAAKSSMDFANSAAETHRLAHRLENKQYYDQLEVRRRILQDHKDLILSLNNTALLNKALSFGQLTVIQYFYEESFYFTAYDKYLQAEWEYYSAMARLYKFAL